MQNKKYKQISLDPVLRQRALQIIELRGASSSVPASDSPMDQLSALVPTAMKAIGETIQAYDRGELPVSTQRQLISTLKKIVKDYEA